MALTLNTSHALYSHLVDLLGIDVSTGTLASAKTERTFTASGSASYPTTSGTFGKAARTVAGTTPGTFAFSPNLVFSNEACTVVAVVNTCSVSGTAQVRQIGSSIRERTPMVQLDDAGRCIVGREYGAIVPGLAVGTSNVTGAAHVLAVTHGPSGSQVYVDGILEGSNATVLDPRVDCYFSHYGGVPGFNAVSADIVWLMVFDKVLSAAELADLTASVGPNNTIGLLESSGGSTPTVTAVQLTPATATVAGGATQQFSAVVEGTNSPSQAVTYSYTPQPAGSSLSSTGLFTAPAATASVQNFTITATSVADPTKFDTSTVQVPAAGAPTVNSVTVSPATATVPGEGTQQLTATVNVSNGAAQTVTWSVSPVGATVSPTGLFTAPPAILFAQTFTVTATSTVDGSKQGTSVITVPAMAAAGTFTLAQCRNNGTVIGNVSIRYSWFPNGRIGALDGIVPIEGVTSSDPAGNVVISGLPTGPGIMLGAQYVNGATDDLVFYAAGTVL